MVVKSTASPKAVSKCQQDNIFSWQIIPPANQLCSPSIKSHKSLSTYSPCIHPPPLTAMVIIVVKITTIEVTVTDYCLQNHQSNTVSIWLALEETQYIEYRQRGSIFDCSLSRQMDNFEYHYISYGSTSSISISS